MQGRSWLEQYEQAHGEEPEYRAAGLVQWLMDQISRRMAELGMTQRDVAARMGTSQAYIAKVLNHHPNLSLSSIFRLADAVGLVVEGFRLVDKRTREAFAVSATANARAEQPEDQAPLSQLSGAGRTST